MLAENSLKSEFCRIILHSCRVIVAWTDPLSSKLLLICNQPHDRAAFRYSLPVTYTVFFALCPCWIWPVFHSCIMYCITYFYWAVIDLCKPTVLTFYNILDTWSHTWNMLRTSWLSNGTSEEFITILTTTPEVSYQKIQALHDRSHKIEFSWVVFLKSSLSLDFEVSLMCSK